MLTVCDDQFEISSKADLPMLRMMVHGRASAFTFDRKETRGIPTRSSRTAATSGRARCGVPAISASDLAEGDRATLVASTENWETVRALSPDGALRAEIDRRKLLLAAAPAVGRSPAPRPRWSSPPTSS